MGLTGRLGLVVLVGELLLAQLAFELRMPVEKASWSLELDGAVEEEVEWMLPLLRRSESNEGEVWAGAPSSSQRPWSIRASRVGVRRPFVLEIWGMRRWEKGSVGAEDGRVVVSSSSPAARGDEVNETLFCPLP